MSILFFIRQLVDIIHLVMSQISVDIFLLDWERPHPVSSGMRPSASAPTTSSGPSSPVGGLGNAEATKEMAVSVWRTYLVANEWNELQTLRKTHLALQVVIVVFILRVRVACFRSLF